MNNNPAVSLLKYSLCAITSTLTTPVFLWLTSFFFLLFRCQQFGSLHLTGEESGHVRSLAAVQNKPGYVRSVSYDPVNVLMFGQEYGRANLLLLSTQIRHLLASESTSESSMCLSSKPCNSQYL